MYIAKIQRTFFVCIFLLFSINLISQDRLEYSDVYRADSTTTYTIKVTFSSSEKKYSLTSQKEVKNSPDNVYKISDAFKESDKDKVRGILYDAIKKHLIDASDDPLQVGKIDNFASQFARNAFVKFWIKINDRLRVKELAGADYQLIEYYAGCGYLITLSPKQSIEDSVLNILLCNNNRYLFSKQGLESEVVQKNLKTILQFIKDNKDIPIPVLELQSGGKSFKGIFDTYSSQEQEINISSQALPSITAQAKDVAGKKVIVPVEAETGSNRIAESLDTNKAYLTVQLGSQVSTQENAAKRHIIKKAALVKVSARPFELKALATDDDSEDQFSIELRDPNSTYKKTYTLSVQLSDAEFRQLLYNDPLLKEIRFTNEDQKLIGEYYIELTDALSQNEEKRKLRKASADKDKKLKDVIEENDKHLKEIVSRIDALAGEKEHSAVLEAREEIPVRECDKNWKRKDSTSKEYLIVDSVIMKVSENVVQLDITGTIGGKKVQTLTNASYGLNLRGLQVFSPELKFYTSGKYYKLYYSEVFYVRPPSDESLSYNLKDGVYRFILKPKDGDPQKKTQVLEIEQKSLLDFISASIFLDLQSFNQESTNKNVLSELYLNFPLNTWKTMKRSTSWARYVNFTLSIGANLFKEPIQFNTVRSPILLSRDSTLITGSNPPSYQYFDSVMSNRYYFNSFDLIRNAAFQLRPMLNIFSWDYKPGNTLIDANIGGLVLGSNGRFLDPEKGKDSVYNKVMFTYGLLAEARVRVFPKSKFGFDFRTVYCLGLNSMSSSTKGITGEYELEPMVKAGMINNNKNDFLQLEANVVFNPKKDASKTSRGGLYLKFNYAKSLHYSDGFFSAFVGYSTDIKNFFR